MVALKKHLLSSLVACSVLASSVNADLSGFISNNLGTSITGEQGGYYKSQVSGYLTGGSTRIRWGGGENIKPFHVQAPSFNVGCSGIDMIFGGFSYLNFEYLVEKLKKIAAAAPAFAFQLALSTLCKDCQAIMTELEKIATAINNLNFDTCQMMTNWTNNIGQSLSTSVAAGQSSSWLDGFKSVSEGSKAMVDRINNFVNNGGFSNGSGESKDDSKQSVKEQLFKEGSLIRIIIKEQEKNGKSFFRDAFGLSDQDYEYFLRALYGDIVAFQKESQSVTDGGQGGTGNVTGNIGTNAEPSNLMILAPTLFGQQLIDVLWGRENGNSSYDLTFTAFDVGSGSTTTPPTDVSKTITVAKSFREILVEKFKNIVIKIQTNGALSEDDKMLINIMPLPLVDVLNAQAIERYSGNETYDFASLLFLRSFWNGFQTEAQSLISKAQVKDQNFVSDKQEAVSDFYDKAEVLASEIDNKLTQTMDTLSKNQSATQNIRATIQNAYSNDQLFN